MVRVTRSRIADVLTGIGSARHTIITASPQSLTKSRRVTLKPVLDLSSDSANPVVKDPPSIVLGLAYCTD